MNFKLEELTKDNEAQYLEQVANLEQVVMENMEARGQSCQLFPTGREDISAYAHSKENSVFVAVDENGKVVATINDADKVLSKYGINLVDTSGKMRDMGTIMDEIGAKWGQMSTLEQNQLAYVVLISYNMK